LTEKYILETGRLLLREMTPDDAENAYRLNLDPEVIRYTGDEPFRDVDEARKFLKNYDHYRKYGFGRWAVISKANQEYLGWCGLKYSADLDEYDIGFRFMKDHWNKGYATESAKVCLEYGMSALKMNMIVGRAMRVNTASINVLKKIGLEYWKDDACGDADGVIYKIEKIRGSTEADPC
jgi:[ribosomal protein S5]-alanine N-acetyltransferase